MHAPVRQITTKDNRPPIVTLEQLKLDYAYILNAVSDLEVEFAQLPPVVEDDEDLTALTAMVGKLGQEAKRCEEVRAAETRPLLDGQSVVNDLFKHDLTKRLSAAKDALSKRADSYLLKKRNAEAAKRRIVEEEARRKTVEAQKEIQTAVQAGDVKAATAAVTHAASLDNFAAKAARDTVATTAELSRTRTESGTASLRTMWDFDIEDLNRIDLEALRPFIPQSAIEQALRAFIKSGRRQIVGARIYEDHKSSFRT